MHAGTGILEFEHVAGKTVPTRAYARSPLRFLTPENRGHFAWAYLSSLGGGFVGGDAVDLRLEVKPGAHALLLSQSATKVYRSPRGASQSIRCRVGGGAVFAHLPDPVICFEDSRFDQRQEYELGADSSLAVLDAVTSGRHCRGERWLFSSYRSDLTVRRAGRLVFHDSVLLDPAHGPLPERLGRFDVLATLLLLGPIFAEPARELLELERKLGRRSALACSVNALREDGIVMRFAAESTEELHRTVKQLLDFLPGLFGDNPWARKW